MWEHTVGFVFDNPVWTVSLQEQLEYCLYEQITESSLLHFYDPI